MFIIIGRSIIVATHQSTCNKLVLSNTIYTVYRRVAQLASARALPACLDMPGCSSVGRTLGLGPRGRQFESGHPDQVEFLAAPASAAKKLYGSCQPKRTFLSSIFYFSFLSPVFNVLFIALAVLLLFKVILIAFIFAWTNHDDSQSSCNVYLRIVYFFLLFFS